MSKAVVVFSGGQDSTTCLGWAKNRYSEVVAISFIYNQKHKVEIEQAQKITQELGIIHSIVDLGFFPNLVNSALTSNGDVNVQHPDKPQLLASFVPNRNALFLTLAHAFAQKIGADAIVTGVCQTDYSGYPDCRINFIQALNFSLNISSEVKIPIETPLMFLNKKEIWELAKTEGVFDLVLNYSHTCYNGCKTINNWGRGCGRCPACKLREKGYEEFIQENK